MEFPGISCSVYMIVISDTMKTVPFTKIFHLQTIPFAMLLLYKLSHTASSEFNIDDPPKNFSCCCILTVEQGSYSYLIDSMS